MKYYTVRVDISRCKEWDLSKYYEQYSGKGYTLLKGAPMLINIDGHYIELATIINGVKGVDKFIVNGYILNILNGQKPRYIRFYRR